MSAVLAPIAFFVLPHSGKLDPADRGDAYLGPYVAFAVALSALQIVMQQVRFEIFSASLEPALLTLAGTAALVWFAWHQTRVEKPLIRLHLLRKRPFQIGLVLYVLYYFISNALGYLISRLLEGGLGYPVDDTGSLLGLTSLGSLVMLFFYFRYSAAITNKKWFDVTGFGIAAAVAIWLAAMPSDISQIWLVPPLVLRGVLLLFIAAPVANVTFKIFAVEEFKHSYRIKNMIKQLAFSFATATIIIFEQHRSALHWTRLAETVPSTNAQVQGTMDSLSHAFELQGRSRAQSHGLALGQIVH